MNIERQKEEQQRCAEIDANLIAKRDELLRGINGLIEESEKQLKQSQKEYDRLFDQKYKLGVLHFKKKKELTAQMEEATKKSEEITAKIDEYKKNTMSVLAMVTQLAEEQKKALKAELDQKYGDA